MCVNIQHDSLVACICEGGAETAIMNMLLEHDLLIFNRQQLIGEEVLKRMSAKEFQEKYLKLEYDKKIIILRIIDSRNEKFPLSEIYRCQVEVIDVITAPEIEMLIIIKEDKYRKFCTSGIQKPSDYCKQVLNMNNVKSPKFIKEYFSNINELVESIREYCRVHKKRKNEHNLCDLLK